MLANQDITRQLRLYYELLLLQRQVERLSDHLAGAAYTIQHLAEEVASLTSTERKKRFRPTIVPIVAALTDTGTQIQPCGKKLTIIFNLHVLHINH